MSYRQILLHLDAEPECAKRIDAALDLASRLDAHVTGVAAAGSDAIFYGADAGASGHYMAEWIDLLEQHARAATQQFETAARQQGYVRIESRVSSADQISAITLNARYADLVVIGQKNPADSVLSGSLVNPGNVVLTCPRPVLVIPYIGAPAGFGNHILIAWNGSRESCRAVTDALPLLKLAGRVTVMAVDPRISNSAHGAAPGADLAKFLASHDVKVTAQPDYSDVDDAGVELLSRAADLGADLLVMGAYGHTRTREWVLGGVTRTILASMTIPVLMSH